jgi:hypothetical protein
MTHAHVNDEQLSAHLDGEGHNGPPDDTPDGGLEAQIASCDACRRRLAALSDARALVRRPVVAVPPSVRAQAVESAIAEVLGPETGVGSTSELAAHRARRSAWPPRALVGAAAAVAVLVVAIGISRTVSHSSSPTASSASAPVTRHRAATSGAPQKALLSPTASIPDLGSVSSPQNLRSRLAPVLASGNDVLGTQGKAATQGSPGISSATPSSTSFEAAGTVPAQFNSCVAAAQRVPGTSGALELVAAVTYRHTPALVVVTSGTGDSSRAAPGSTGVSGPLAVVVARSDCRVLARTTP